MTQTILEAQELKKYFPMRAGVFSKVRGYVKAVDSVSIKIKSGETLGLVGESGCGKSTLGRLLLRLVEPTAGETFFEGTNIYQLDSKKLRDFRRHFQIIFQDPYASLNPKMKIGNIIGEPLVVYNLVSTDQEKRKRVEELLEIVGLSKAHYGRFPHEFSGGQRQRIGIARALTLNPKLVICDEAVSALDVSVQAQVLNLLKKLQKDFGLTYVFISHDLSVVKYISDRVGVMYLGKIVELGDCNRIYKEPAHPYTKALLSSVPEPNPRRRKEHIILEGEIPNPLNPPDGCTFHPRCPQARDICSNIIPQFRMQTNGHWLACHAYD